VGTQHKEMREKSLYSCVVLRYELVLFGRKKKG
jgi:hypothetical protein